MSLEIACSTCRQPFDAELHAGLVRCAPCEDRQALRLPGTGASNVFVIDTPGEAWA